MNNEELTESCFLFLNRVQESGSINMVTASPMLQEEFGLGRNDARRMLVAWMDWVRENPSNRDL